MYDPVPLSKTRRAIMQRYGLYGVALCLFSGWASGQSNTAWFGNPETVALAEVGQWAVKTEMKGLEGTWQVVAFERDGRYIPCDPEPMLWAFKGNQVKWRSLPNPINLLGSYTLDLSKDPKGIDLFDEGQNYRAVGIYELKGNWLMLRFHHAQESRPTEFKTKRGAHEHFLLVLKRL
jgi:uncharacterized protein (TIGR03067 family)